MKNREFEEKFDADM